MKDNTILTILAILLLLLVWNIQTETFILFGGVEIEGSVSDIKGECWTLATSDRCARQNVFLINLTKQNLLVCPDGYYSTERECQIKYGIILIEKPKIDCFFIDKETDKCFVDEFLEEDGCPALYFTSLEDCEEARKTFFTHIKLLFKNKATLIALIAGVIALFVLVLKKR